MRFSELYTDSTMAGWSYKDIFDRWLTVLGIPINWYFFGEAEERVCRGQNVESDKKCKILRLGIMYFRKHYSSSGSGEPQNWDVVRPRDR
jgi:hypothetical protein